MKKKLTNNLGFKIISVILAIMLWLVVLNVSDPEKTTTIVNIPITILNESAITGQEKIYQIIAGKTATVKVTGPRTIIDSLEASSFKATADMADLSMTNAVEVKVELIKASYRSKVSIDVQTTMRIAVEDLVHMEFTAEVAEQGKLPEGYVVFGKNMDKTIVNITAPKSVMDTIAKVAAVVDLTGRNEDFSTVAKFQAFDNRGNLIGLESKNVSFDIPETKVDMTIYAIKQIPLVYQIDKDRYPDTVITSDTINREMITIAGRSGDLSTINELVLDTSSLVFEADKSRYDLTYNLQELLPKGIYVYGNDKTAMITVETDAIITKTFTLPTNEIAIKSLSEGFSASHETSGSIEYTLKGKKSILDNFDPNNNQFFVSTKDLSEGEYNLEVQTDLEEGLMLANPVFVKVKITKKEDGSQTTTKAPETSSSVVTSQQTTTTTTQETSSKKEDEETTTNNTEQQGGE